MKKLVIIISLLLLSSSVFSQNIMKVRAKHLSYINKDDYGNWEDWPDPVETNVLITFDTDNEVLNIYSKEEQVYSVINSEVTEKFEELNFYFNCIDQKGQKCQVIITRYSDPVDTGKITIIYPSMAWVYMIVWI